MLSYDIDSSTQVKIELDNNYDYVQIGDCKLFCYSKSPTKICVTAESPISHLILNYNLKSYQVDRLGRTEKSDQVTNISVCDNCSRLIISFISNYEICEFVGYINNDLCGK